MHICVFLILPLRLFPMSGTLGDLEPAMGLVSDCVEGSVETSNEKHMALLGMQPPAAGPVRAVFKSLGIKEYND